MNEVTCFTLWMLLFPLVDELVNCLVYGRGRRFENWMHGVSGLFSLIIWFYVGSLLYRLI